MAERGWAKVFDTSYQGGSGTDYLIVQDRANGTYAIGSAGVGWWCVNQLRTIVRKRTVWGMHSPFVRDRQRSVVLEWNKLLA